MTMSRREALAAGASLPASALVIGAVSAQAAAVAPAKDPLLAACLLIGGRKQIENCTFALKKLTHKGAQDFARAEIEEHQTVKAELQKLGYAYPVTPAQTNVAPGGTVSWMVASGRTPLSADAANLVAIDHEVAEQCIANYRKEMDQLTGRELDMRFVGHQLDVHLALRDKVQVFRRHASAEMAPTLDTGLKTIESHISTLKQLKRTLDDNRQGGTDRGTGGGTERRGNDSNNDRGSKGNKNNSDTDNRSNKGNSTTNKNDTNKNDQDK